LYFSLSFSTGRETGILGIIIKCPFGGGGGLGSGSGFIILINS